MPPLRPALLIALALATPLQAEDPASPNVAPTSLGTPGAAAQLALAQDLYILGRAGKDPLTVLTAAKLASAVLLTEVERTHTTDGTALPDQTDPTPSPAGPETMRTHARVLAGRDEALLSLIDLTEAEAPHGRQHRAAATLSRLPAGQTDVWQVPFFGQSQAELAVIGDGDGPLELTVTDEPGTTICADTNAATSITCRFVPLMNGYFRVAIRNTGQHPNTYRLVTN